MREFADPKDFSKKAVVEKLELSRRYWAILDISDWKLVVSDEAITVGGGYEVRAGTMGFFRGEGYMGSGPIVAVEEVQG